MESQLDCVLNLFSSVISRKWLSFEIAAWKLFIWKLKFYDWATKSSVGLKHHLFYLKNNNNIKENYYTKNNWLVNEESLFSSDNQHFKNTQSRKCSLCFRYPKTVFTLSYNLLFTNVRLIHIANFLQKECVLYSF